MAEKKKYVLQLISPDGSVYREEFAFAYSRKQAWQVFRFRARRQGWDYLLSLDSLRPDIQEVATAAIPPKPPREETWDYCPRCSNEVENDYCNNCGWQRYSSRWYSKALSKVT